MTLLKKLFAILSAAILIGTLIPPQAVLAQAGIPLEGYYRENNITFFGEDPACVGVGAGGSPVSGGSGTVDPSAESDNVRIAYEFFVSKGLAPFRSAGIVGNLQVEAPGLDPRINQGGGGAGRGIGQWSAGGRWDTDPDNVVDFARGPQGQGRSEYDLTLQLDFIWYEMNNVAPWKESLPAVQSATTIEQATRAFMEEFEGPGVPHFDRRLTAANTILTLYGNGAPTGGPPAVGGTTPASGGGATGPGSIPIGGAGCAASGGVSGAFTGAPGQTIPQAEGFTLADNTDYAAAPCAPGSTETRIYRHPIKGFQVRLCKVKSMEVASIISDRVVAMVNAAQAAGINLNGGAFRSYEQQKQTRIKNGCPNDSTPSSGCSPPTARPGNSQHERGLAIDFSSGGTIRRGSPEFNWLSANAAQYGFHNLPSESWHWSTSGN